MRETVKEPNTSGSRSSSEQLGARVHQLLNLAAALSSSAADAPASGAPSPIPAPAASASASASASSYGMPLGMDTGTLSDEQCINWAQDVEALLRWGQALAVQVAGEMDHRVAAGRFAETGARGAVGLLVQSLQLSGREATQRLHLAKQILPIPDSISGQVAPPAHPVLGQAFFAGKLSPERALTAARFLQDAQRLRSNGIIDQDTAANVEQSLTTTALEEGPDFVRAVGNQIMSHIDPDGNKPSESDLRAKQGLFFRRPKNGLVGIYGHCTVEQYEQVMAAISHEANPNKHKDVNTINAEDIESEGANNTPTDETSTDEATTDEATTDSSPRQESLLDHLSGISTSLNRDNGANPRSSEPGEPDGPNTKYSGHHGDENCSRDPESSADTETTGTSGTTMPKTDKTAGTSEPSPGMGWQARLTESEIPPRPPNAPEDAIPPVYAGEGSFWIDPAGGNPGLWEPKGTDDFNIWEQPAASKPTPPPSAASAPASTPASTPASASASAQPSADRHTSNQASSEPINQPANEPGNGFGAGWAGGPLGSPFPQDGETGEPWPRLVDGVWIPAPGSDAEMAGLDSTDPASGNPATKDTRTRGQKMLDGLIDCVKLAARTGTLPMNGGLRTQLIITTTEEDLRRTDGLGTGFTTYSGPMPLGLFDTSLCDPEVTRLVYGNGQEIINAGRTQRLFTTAQRKLLYARDLGCSFPDCISPAVWCEGHHIIPWQQGGATDISNACLLCSRHHTLVHQSDWEIALVEGTPWFTPPWSVNRERTPLRNRFHHGLAKE